MQLIDLTHMITEGMPVYPGTEPPILAAANSIEEHGFKETLITMYSHTGTHMDAPAHLYHTGKHLEECDISQFYGKAVVVDCTDFQKTPNATITMQHIESMLPLISKADFVLFRTGWSNYWLEPGYFEHFPTIDQDIASFLVAEKKKGIGVDTISVDPMAQCDLPVHQTLLSGGMVIMENLTNLDKVGKNLFTLCVFPLRFQHADGSPIRAVALLEP